MFAKCTWRRWKWHTDDEYADEIVKLQREFDRQFQDLQFIAFFARALGKQSDNFWGLLSTNLSEKTITSIKLSHFQQSCLEMVYQCVFQTAYTK